MIFWAFALIFSVDDNAPMKTYLEVAVFAAKLAGQSILESAKGVTSLMVEQKTLHDYVSEVDRRSEQIIVEEIKLHFPDHQILGEEYGEQGAADSDYQWIIDPLDGTTNFLRSIPHYAVSIGLRVNGVITEAVVFDPAKNDLFIASRGKGASLNSMPLSVSNLSSIRSGLLATGVPFSGDNLANVSSFTNTMEGLLALQTSGIRRLGSAALDLAYVAAGRYDGYWEASLKPWDIAAGVLLVEEAGGMVTDLQGGNDYMHSGDVLAANSAVHSDMLEVTSRTY